MKEDFELPEIDINEIKLYPEMDKNIADLLSIRNNDIVSMYAAKLIQKYQAMMCKTCKWHTVSNLCVNEKIYDNFYTQETDTGDTMRYHGDCTGFFMTGDKFGCVHHSEKEEKDGV